MPPAAQSQVIAWWRRSARTAEVADAAQRSGLAAISPDHAGHRPPIIVRIFVALAAASRA